MTTIIKGGRVMDPSQNIDGLYDILIRDGKIEKIGAKLKAEGAEIIDASGLVAAPGLIDMHCHLRDPGYEYKEDIISGGLAAAYGGFTSIFCMPNTKPPADNPETIKYIINKAEKASVRVYPIAAVTQGQKGELLCDFKALKNAGAAALSDDGWPVSSASVMKRAIIAAAEAGLLIISHCEDMSLAAENQPEAEEVMAAREAVLAASCGLPVHIAHVSTKNSVEIVRQAKKNGVKITCETCPHYMLLTEEAAKDNTNAKMNPPLRREEDRRAIIEGLLDGTIDAIATDHAPHHEDEKNTEFKKAPNGVIGFETALSAALSVNYNGRGLEIAQIIRLMSTRPAEILKIPGGSLKTGMPADIVIFDPEAQNTVDPALLHSKSKNTPFAKMTLKGRVIYTLVGGKNRI